MSKTKVKQKVSIDYPTSVLPTASLLLAVNRTKQDKGETSTIESYKLKLLGDIAQGLWDNDNTRALVFNLSQHVESHKARFKLALPAEMGVEEDWDSIEEFLLDHLAKELNKVDYKLFSATNLSGDTELLITWGWYEYDGIIC